MQAHAARGAAVQWRSPAAEQQRLPVAKAPSHRPCELLVRAFPESACQLYPACSQAAFSRQCCVLPYLDYAASLAGDCVQVGLEPDIKCVPEQVEASVWSQGQQAGDSYADDPCVQLAKQLLQGG